MTGIGCQPISCTSRQQRSTCRLGHVGHRTAAADRAGSPDLIRLGHDVGDLGHEMHAAENDVFGVGLRGEAGRQLERIAGQVGVLIRRRAGSGGRVLQHYRPVSFLPPEFARKSRTVAIFNPRCGLPFSICSGVHRVK